ncbi:MAG: phage tail assembly chaperone [Dinoroseobacter sp.]|nr:phage tail assembly chaperone [Dinoroseobacter sp.]MDJ0992608.1 phage tail assembly chaperone [Dinoroseobacter sp.]
MTRLDWPGLMRVGLKELGLSPGAFWALTPVELMILLGVDESSDAPLGRARLEELIRAFPDQTEDISDE